MVSKIPILFRTTRPNSITSYDFVDIASGRGYIKYWMFATSDNSGVSYNLTQNQIYSDASQQDGNDDNYICSTAEAQTNITATKVLDMDFDLLIDRPIIIEGDAFFTGTVEQRTVSGSGSTTGYLIVKVRKVNNASTESDILSVTGGTFTNGARSTLKLTIPRNKFKSGEKIRITVEVYVTIGAGVTKDVSFGHDPLGTAGAVDFTTAGDSESYIILPLVIE